MKQQREFFAKRPYISDNSDLARLCLAIIAPVSPAHQDFEDVLYDLERRPQRLSDVEGLLSIAQARKLEREKRLMLAEAAIAKADELEVIALGSLIRNSEHAKLLISRLINRTIEELGDPEIKPRDRALGLGALAGVIKLVYRWHEEPSVSEMQHAQNGMINLTLQATLPYDLKRLALARTGSLATQHDDQGGGPCPDGEDFSGPDSPSGFAGNYGNRRRLCARLLFGITRGHKPERHGDCFLFFTASEANSKCDIAQTAQEVAKRAFASTVLLVMEDANEQPLSLGSGSVSVMGR